MRVTGLTSLFVVGMVAGCVAITDSGADSDLSWLSGCWAQENGATRETWSAPQAGLMFGYSVTMRDGKAVFFEDLRIETRRGDTVYVASPNGAPPTEFTEVSRTATSITLENGAHDYPQLIVYDQDGDRLAATISLLDGSKSRTFPMRRCEGDAPG